MPRLNGTGPQGAGPMTGRGMGYCNTANANTPVFGKTFGFGRGRGFGKGFGRGLGRGFGFPINSASLNYANQNISPEQQKDMLNQEKAFLENELKRINEQIDSDI